MCKDFLDYWRGSVNQVVLAEDEIFVDRSFGPSARSLYVDIDRPPAGMPPASTVEWLRPSSFCPDSPTLFTSGSLANGLKPGSISNKWFLSALHIVSSNMNLIKNLFVHTGQEGHGRYCVKFNKEGTWVNAIIDDQMPFNRMGQPLFVQGADRNEIWAMLVEKAYAKIHGGYERIIEGDIEYALKDLTGGIPTVVDTNKDPKFQEKVAQGKVWLSLKSQLRHGIVGCSSTTPEVVTNEFGEVKLMNREGIIKGYGYSVLDTVEINEKRLKLVKIGNPWGIGNFTGDWSNDSPLWQEDPETSRTCKHNPQVDSTDTFWMTMNDFVRIFNIQYFCKILPEEWQTVRRTNSFPVKGGGCVNFPSWVQNEQILIDVEDDTDVVITITQQDDLYHKDRATTDKNLRPSIGCVCHKFKFSDIELGHTRKLTTMRSTGIELISPFTSTRDSTMTGELKVRASLTKNGRFGIAMSIMSLRHFCDHNGRPALLCVRLDSTLEKKKNAKILFFLTHNQQQSSNHAFIIFSAQVGRYVILPQTFDPDSGCKYWVTIQSRERMNVYAGTEIDWDEKYLDPNLEGDNEMEQDLSKHGVPAKHGYEESNRVVAIQSAAKMIAELTVMARSLSIKRDELHKKLHDLTAAEPYALVA